MKKISAKFVKTASIDRTHFSKRLATVVLNSK